MRTGSCTLKRDMLIATFWHCQRSSLQRLREEANKPINMSRAQFAAEIDQIVTSIEPNAEVKAEHKALKSKTKPEMVDFLDQQKAMLDDDDAENGDHSTKGRTEGV
ncbi:uncharacterized protein LOC124261059 isoform X2 [Haliotis rubra]|uniref:uncharacterized protein LOC124261059 isoform X2 n=1 Tax=Haliotis rubra TaxID=36100 RepID=UPI001EE5336A|nr:uncharacterized protein LOC124261059 isoform X2 [Haliotis rubra]